ncbi:MAG: hypothetical protein ACREOI_11845 [bacterium]
MTAYPRVEMKDVRLSFVNGENDSQRAENISRLIFAYVQELMERELQHLGAEMTIEQLEVPAVRVSFGTMDDEAIARASATEVVRALLQSL